MSDATAAGSYPIERWQRDIAEGFAGTRPLDDASLRGAVEAHWRRWTRGTCEFVRLRRTREGSG